MKTIKSILLILFACCLVTAVKASPENAQAGNSKNTPSSDSAASGEKSQDPAPLPDAAPLKGLSWIKGGPVTLKKGHIYVVEFWATWCAPCRKSIPHLSELQHQYKDKGVTFVGISTEAPDTVKPFVSDMGDQMNYSVAVDTDGFVNKHYMQAFNKQGIPQAFLINKAGKIVWEGHPMSDLNTVLEQVVKGTFDPVAYAKAKAEAEKLQRQINEWFMTYFTTLEENGLTNEAKQAADKLIENAPGDVLNAFAWNILTRVPADNQDIPTALKAAKKANTLSEGQDPSVLDTYALALFESGKVQDAIDTVQKAINLAADYPQAQEQFRQRLEQYKAALGAEI